MPVTLGLRPYGSRFVSLTAAGTVNTLTKWVGASTIGDSTVSDDGTNVTLTTNLKLPQTTATTGIIKMDGNPFIHAFKHPTGGGAVPDGQNTAVGIGAANLTMGSTAASTAEGSYNTLIGYYSGNAITTGYLNTAIGWRSLVSNTTAYENAAFGTGALGQVVTGGENSAVGTYALYSALGNRNVALGYSAGRYETGSDALYIDNRNRTNTAGDKAGAIIYGVMAAAAANQRLQINATAGIGVAATATEQVLITPNANTVIGLTVKGAASQSANLTEWQTSTGAVVAALKDCTGISSTPTAGFTLANNSPATNGNQQYSPSLVLTGDGYKTDATPGSWITSWDIHVQPIQGSSAPTSLLIFDAKIGAGAFDTKVYFTNAGAIVNDSFIESGGYIKAGFSSVLGWVDRSQMTSSADGIVNMMNATLNSFTRLNLGGSTSSFSGIGFDSVNGFTLQSAAGTSTWNDASTAGSGTVANRYLFGIAAPTLTATNASVTDTVASTVYIGGAPTQGTNTTIGTAYALNVAAGNCIFGGNVAVSGDLTGKIKVVSKDASYDFDDGTADEQLRSAAIMTTASDTFTLDAATVGKSHVFIVNNAGNGFSVVIDPDGGTDRFVRLGTEYSTAALASTAGTTLSIICVETGHWTVIGENGTITFS